ncbi:MULTISPECIES: carbohydrate ABC transporter permease [Caproicibacterium]|uniref:Carbohydrate ABC transporter permease n=1 Tax=Caproicibacterium argilliputei TaxID=3030016 RepID=A0AA97DC09_9FIRM|nr:carbohydrate ABC transporter permease [Caproicibacterium argilliputei]WOC32800.1 carbohydrate ABC transporter permease [Caproicibacterium argilliputei]
MRQQEKGIACSGVSAKKRKKAWNALFIVLAVGIGVAIAFPLFWLIRSSFVTKAELFARPPVFWPKEMQFENFSKGVLRINFLQQLWNSVSIAVPYVAGTVVTCALSGYAFARLRFPLRRMWFALVISSMMLPSVVTLLPQVRLYSALGIANRWALIVPAFLCAGGNAYFVYLLRQFFTTIPKELDEAASIDGAGHVRTFLSIMVPLVKPALIVVGLFSFINCWNEIFYSTIYLQSEEQYTLPLGLLMVQGIKTPNYEQVMALTVLVSLPCLVFFFIGNRYFVEGISTGAVKG